MKRPAIPDGKVAARDGRRRSLVRMAGRVASALAAASCAGCYIALVPPSTPDYYKRPTSAYEPVNATSDRGSSSPAISSADRQVPVRIPPPPPNWKPPLLAVWNLSTGEGVPRSLAEPLSESVRADLVKSGWFRVVLREDMSKVLKEHQIQLSDACDNVQCAVEFGRLLVAESFLVGTVAKVESTYQIVLTLVDVESAEITAVGKAFASGTNVLYDITMRATADLLQKPPNVPQGRK